MDLHNRSSHQISAARRRLRAAALSAIGAATAFGISNSPVSADTIYTWTGTTSSAWNVATNWNPNTAFPKTSSSIAEFTGAPANAPINYNVTGAANQTIDQIYFAGVTSAFTINGANTLNLNASSSAVGSGSSTNVGLYQDAASTNSTTPAVVKIAAPKIVLLNNQTWEIDGDGVAIGNAAGAGGISGTGTLNKTGGGTLTFNNNLYTGGQITVSAGELELSSTNANPNVSNFSSAVKVGGVASTPASLILDGGGTTGTTLNSAVTVLGGGGTVTLGNNSDSGHATYNGTITLGHAATFAATNAATVVDVNGQLTGGFGIIKNGPGVLNLTNTTNNYTGTNSTINRGQLRANNGFTGGVANGSATGTSTIGISGTVGQGNIATLGGNGGVSGNVNLTVGDITAGADTTHTGHLAIGQTLAIAGGASNAYVWKAGDLLAGTKGSTDGWDDVTAHAINFTGLTSATPFTVSAQGLTGVSLPSVGSTTWIIAESATGSIGVNGSPVTGTQSLAGNPDFVFNQTGFTVPAGGSFHLGFENVGGSEDLAVTYSVASTPEPTSALLFGIGAIPMLIKRRRQTSPALG